MGEKEIHAGFWWVNLKERDHMVYPGVDGRIRLNVYKRNRI
jgi:hypothetical protein